MSRSRRFTMSSLSTGFVSLVRLRRGYTWIGVKFEVFLKGIRIKMGWKHYQTVDHLKWEPQVGIGLFGIRLLILHFKFQFSKSIKSWIFHIFLNLTYSLRKNIRFPKMSKNHPKIYTKRKTEVMDLALLKTWPRYWHKGRVKRHQNSLHVYPRLNIEI